MDITAGIVDALTGIVVPYVVFIFGLSALIMGAVAIYVGTGKSKDVGAMFMFIGAIVSIMMLVLNYVMQSDYLMIDIGEWFFSVLGAILGAVVGIVLFLGMIIKA